MCCGKCSYVARRLPAASTYPVRGTRHPRAAGGRLGRVSPVPPPLVALAAALAQRALTRDAPAPTVLRAASAASVAVASIAIASAAASRFRRTGTTLEPMHPDRVSVLVTSGANAVTRNPMYVGVAGILVANAIRKGRWVALVPVVGFVGVVDRLQIRVEEAALRGKFGEQYEAYCRAVPRWLDRRSVQAGRGFLSRGR